MAVFEGEARIQIDAPPEKVWALVSDITRMGEWSPENLGGEWQEGSSEPSVGAKFKAGNKQGRMKWSTTCEVTESEPGKVFAFSTKKKKGDDWTRWRYSFEPAAGGTAVTESYEAVSYPLYLRVIAPPKRRSRVLE